MEYLDAHKDEILTKLLEGDWRSLLPSDLYSEVVSWFKRHRDDAELVVRFVCQSKNQKYAVYFICDPSVEGNKFLIKDLVFSDPGRPLAIVPCVYSMPLFCMPNDLYSKILRKKS